MNEVIVLTDSDKVFGYILLGILIAFLAASALALIALGLKAGWKVFKFFWDELNDW